ncbi:hypothetical protein MAR_019993 [Mya arenaria]|uniref:Uncharacterized protein n=1 Tax=Mya arenaria TaxID=6604 RepID=A0ABY7E898_MYAAR|nr:hypothetical protein MAR_019993 [Mya arenaria]
MLRHSRSAYLWNFHVYLIGCKDRTHHGHSHDVVMNLTQEDYHLLANRLDGYGTVNGIGFPKVSRSQGMFGRGDPPEGCFGVNSEEGQTPCSPPFHLEPACQETCLGKHLELR